MIIGSSYSVFLQSSKNLAISKAGKLKKVGDKEYQTRNYHAAIQLYSTAISIVKKYCNLTTACLHYNSSLCYEMLFDYFEALEQATIASRLDPLHSKSYIIMAKCTLMVGNIKKLEFAVGKLLELSAKNDEVSVAIRDMIKLHELDKTIRELDQLQSHDDLLYHLNCALILIPKCVRYHLMKAECNIMLGRYEDSVTSSLLVQEYLKSFWEIMQSNNGRESLNKTKHFVKDVKLKWLHNSALYHFKTGNMHEALLKCNEGLEIESNYSKLLELRSMCHNEKNKELAIVLYDPQSKTDEIVKTQSLLKQIGNAYFKSTHFYEAEACYTNALNMGQHQQDIHSKLHFNRALVNYKTNYRHKAIYDCTKALFIDSTLHKALILRSRCYIDLQMYDHCIADCEYSSNDSTIAHMLKESKTALYNAQIKPRINLQLDLKHKGHAMLKLRCNAEALSLYTHALQMDETNSNISSELLYSQALVYIQINDKLKAIRACSQALQITFNHQKALLLRARCYQEMGWLQQTVIDCDTALKQVKHKETLKLKQAAEQAIEQLKLQENIKNQNCMNEKGNSLFQSGQFNDAVVVFTDALECGQFNEIVTCNLHYMRSMAYYKLNSTRNALADCTKILEINCKHINALLLRASCHRDLQMFEHCIKDYENALKQSKTSETKKLLSEAKSDFIKFQQLELQNTGNALFKSECYQEALTLYTQALEIDNSHSNINSELLYNRAVAHFKLDSVREALNNCKNALQINPEYLKALMLQARCHYDLKLYQECVADYEAALKQRTTPEIEGLKQAAVLALEESIKQEQLKKQNDMKNEGNFWFDGGSYKNAVSAYTRAFQFGDLNEEMASNLYYNRALANSKMHNMNQSISDCTKALNINCRYLKALLLRARCYREQRNFEQCIADYDLALGQSESSEIQELKHQSMQAFEEHKLQENIKKQYSMKEKANLLYKSGRYIEALKAYNDALQLGQFDKVVTSNLHYNKALVYSKLDSTKLAISECTNSLNLNSGYEKALLLRGRCYNNLKMFEECVSDYEAALKLSNTPVNQNLVYTAKTDLRELKKEQKIKQQKLLIEQAHSLFESKLFSEAVSAFSQAIDVCELKEDVMCQLLVKRAEAYVELNSIQLAISDCVMALGIDSNNVGAFLCRARCYIKLNLLEQSVADYNCAYKRQPSYSIRSELLKAEAALSKYRKETNIKKQKNMKEQGNSVFNVGRYHEALSLYSDALNMGELNKDVTLNLFFNRALVYSKLNRMSEAISDCTKSLNYNPRYLKALLLRARCYSHLKNFELCIKDYETALQQSKSSEIQTNLNEAKNAWKEFKLMETRKKQLNMKNKGNDLFKSERYREALNTYTEALHLDETNSNICPELLYNRALVHSKMESTAEVISDCTKALNIKPKYLKALLLRARYYSDLEKFDLCICDYVNALKISKTTTIENLLSKARSSLRKFKEQQQKIQKQLELKEKGNALLKAEHYQQALSVYGDALKLGEINKEVTSNVLYNKALIFCKIGSIDDVISECTKTLNVRSGCIKALLLRARCYTDLEKFEKSICDYEAALKESQTADLKKLLEETKMALIKSKHKDYYQILGITRNASNAEIKKAYHHLSRVHHPDRHSNKTIYEQQREEVKFKNIKEAYEKLYKKA